MQVLVHSHRTGVKKRMEASPVGSPISSIPSSQVGAESNILTAATERIDVNAPSGIDSATIRIVSPKNLKTSVDSEDPSGQTVNKDIISSKVPIRRTRSKNIVSNSENPEESNPKDIQHRFQDSTLQATTDDMYLPMKEVEEISPDDTNSFIMTSQTSPAKPKPSTINNLKNALADLNARSKLRLESFSIHRPILDTIHPGNTLLEKNVNEMNDEPTGNLVPVGLIDPLPASNTYSGQESPDFFEKPLRTPKPKIQGKSAKTPRRTPRSISRNGKLLSSKKKAIRESQRSEMLWQDYTIDVPLTSPLTTTQPKTRSPDRHLRTPAMLAKLKMKRTSKSNIAPSPLKTITSLNTIPTTGDSTLMMSVDRKETETSGLWRSLSIVSSMPERSNIESNLIDHQNSDFPSRTSPLVRRTVYWGDNVLSFC